MLVAKTKENLKECRCTECPSYTMGCKIKNYPINMIKALNNLDEVEHFLVDGLGADAGLDHLPGQRSGPGSDLAGLTHQVDLSFRFNNDGHN